MQIVGYRPRFDGPAALEIASAGSVRTESLAPGTELTYSLGDRHCAGTVEDDSHVACDASVAPYCEVHRDRWPCARCRGDCSMPIDACHEEHAVYLAAFAPATFKVGVTRSWRLERRLREQGADRGAHLRTVADGRIARQIEADIASDVGDRVRVPDKIAGLHQSVDDRAWAALLATYDHVETRTFEYGLALEDQPIAETILSGTVVGTKGRVLVLENNGNSYAVDLAALVGYELTDEASDRSLQSSLTTFSSS